MIACRLLGLRLVFVRSTRKPARLARRLAALALLLPGVALADPTLVKSFAPDTIGSGSASTLVIELDNAGSPPVRGLTFTDDLPSDVFLASPANARTDCTGAVVTAPDGGARIEFSGGQLPVDGSCQLSVDVTSAVVGTHTNSIFELTWEGGGTEFNASADLTVSEALPGFRKTFAPGSIPLGGTSQLTLTVDNTANPEGLGSFSFTDNLPAGMVVATPSNAATDCGNPQFPPTLTAVSGTGLVSLFANGFLPSFPALPAGASCTVTVDVTTNATGAFENITGELLIPPSGSAGFASALLEVPREYLVKSFVDDPVPPGGTVTLEFTVTNLSRDGTATDIAFNDDLEVVLAGLAPDGPLPTLPCGTGSALDFTAGVLTLDAGTLAPGDSCAFGVPLLVPAGAAAGGFTNTTDPLTALIDGTPVVANTATDILRVQAVPILTKEFLGDPVGAGGTVTLEFTVTNTNPDLSLDEIAFVDELTSFLPFPVSVTLPAAGFCGPSSSMALVSLGTDRQGLQMTEGSLAAAGSAGDSCTFSVTIDIPAGMPAGIYTNTTGDISGEIDTCDDGCLEPISGLPASDDLEVVAAPRLTKAFTDDPALPGATVTLEFTLSHDEFAPGDATAITFTDDLAAVLPGLTATGLPMTDLCGPGNGSLDGTAMDTALSFSATTLAPGETCSFSVTLQVPDPAAAGSYANTTSGVVATVLGVTATGNAASDDLDIAGLTLTKEFIDDPVLPGETATLRFTLENAHPTDDATGIIFFDDLDAALNGLAATGLPITACGGTLSGTSSLTFSGGSLAAGDPPCPFDVTVQVLAGAEDGVYTNTTSNVFATLGGTQLTLPPAVDGLTVNSSLLLLSKEFTDDPATPGSTVTLEFTLNNLDAVATITDIAFTDALDAALSGLVATGLPIAACGGTLSGTNEISLTGASLDPSGSCSFSATLMVPADVPLGTSVINTTSEVTGQIGGFAVTGAPAIDELLIDFLAFSKSFDRPVVPGDVVTLTFSIQNLDASNPVSAMGFSDDLDAVVPGLAAIGLPMADVCGPGSQLAGTSFLTLSGANLLPGGSCTFSVDLQLPAEAAPGTYPNITSELLVSGLPYSNPASADLEVLAPASIVIVKDTAPAGATGFAFTSSLDPAGFTLDDGQEQRFEGLYPGSYSVTEILPLGWDLTDLICSDPTEDTTTTGATANIELAAGETVTCTFTNTQRGSIVIEKVTEPAGATGFAFSDDIVEPNSFSLDDGQSRTFSDLLPGSYTVSETVPAGWDLSDLSCVDASGGTTTDGATAGIDLAPGETVICTFTNTQQGAIVVEKQTLPDGSPASFSFSGDASGSVGDGGQIVVSGLVPGTYTSTEAVPAGWILSGIVCDDSNSSGDVGTATATFQVEPGETVTCVFTDTQLGGIVVEKQTLPDGAPDSFGFSGDAVGTIADGGTISVSNLVPGTYTSTEAALSGWDLTDISCDDANSSGDLGTATATFNVEPGETVKCTFTNTQQGSIVVEKQTLPDGAPDSFDFSGDAAGAIADGGTITVSGLASGSYTSTETVPSGWDLTSIVCDDTNSGGDLGTATATFNVEPGETVRCTFTNVQQGSIVISKSTEPSGGVGFGFSDDIVEPGSFVLDHAESMVFDNVSPGSYLVVEDDPSGLGYALTGLTCTDSDGGGVPSEIVLPTRSVAINLDPGETVSCSFTNQYAGAIKVEKATNGFDADLPPGPTLVVGDTVTWTYQVSNTGIETLTDILVTDDQVGVIDCPQTSLAPGETMLCTAQGVVMAGSYSNLAIASGLLFLEQVVTNADPSHYFGVTEQVLALEKLTNGEDADLAPGPVLAVGDPVTWSYQVSNTGSETLDQVTVSDDQGLAVVCPQTQLAPSESMTCTATGFAEPGQYANVGIASAQTPAGSQVLASDPSHYFGQVVQIEKTTNGEDADTAPGPVLPVGTPVQWIYTISNPGPEALTGILVSDDQGLAVDCPATDLAPRGIMICTASGIAEPGQYANVGSVSAQLPGGGSVVAADPSHYFGQVLQLEKTTNGIDADTAPGPFLEIGAPVTWEYLVTNLGSELLSNVSVVDDQGVAVSCPATTLDPGQTMTCSGQGTVEAGQYANLGSATALSPDETLLEAADPSHYFGQVLRIEKLTNGEDADIAPGPSLTVGAAVTWTYEISNLGSETLSNVSVSDDQGVLVDCPQTLLAAGESMTCSASGVVQAGQYANLGTVTATLPGGEIPPGGGEPTDGLSLSASDPSHYFGQPLVLEKATNGEDADVAPGPSVLVGSDISWTYQVTNLASVAVANVSVSDDQGVAVSCPADSLAPGASMTCTGSGTAVTGQYANLGQVTAELPDSTRVEASDPSHYFGENAAIDLEKFTNGENADAAPGPVIPAGDAVSWTYLVTNTGDVGLVEIAVSDDQGVAVSCPGTTLGVGERMTCTGSGIAQPGQYANLGSVGALSEGGIPVADSDPSHYFGETGTIVIAKLTNPGGGSGFDFSEDIQGVGFSLNDGESTSFEQVVPGTYSVTELVPADWALTDLSCQDPSADSSVNGATATIVLGAGETVRCTFTNTALGSILIEKATAPEGGTGFDFSSDIEEGGFSLDDGQVKSFSGLLPGSYSVTELVPAGWDLSGISCDDPSGDSGGDGATALIGLAAGETVRCTFSNAQRGGIVIEKTSDPAGGTGFEFSHDIDENGSFTLDDGGSLSFADLPAGLYTVTEAVPQGWVLLDLVCEDPSGGTERLGSAALIDLAPGEMVTCSFGNVAALIEITKTALSTPVTVGETAAFTIALRNSGLVTLSNLMVSDPLSPDCTRAAGELPDLAPGASTSYDCSSEPLFGDLRNQATVTADVPEGPPISASASALVEVIAPQVEIDKQAAETQILAGEIAVFTISIHNPGDSPLLDVRVLDDLTPDCVRELGSLPDLAPGATLSYECTTDPLGEDLENLAQVLAFNAAREEVSASATALVQVIQPLALTKTPSEQEILAGDSAVFTLTISNPGAVEKTNLLVEDPLVPACGFALDSLAPGASVSQSCESGPLFADLTNRASATADSPAGPVTASATAVVTVLQPSIGIAKTPEAQLVNIGEAASFTITLSNPGDTTLTELVVSDPLTPNCERGLGELDALAPGASVSYACASGPLDAGFTNLVSVSGFAGALPVAASASALVTLRQPILIEKSPAEQSVPIGASAEFTITVSNPGEDLKTGVRVEDPLSPDCARATGEIPDLQPNGGAFTYVCSSGPLDLDLLNQATVIAQGAEGQVSASDSALALVLEPLVTFSKIALEPQIEAGTPARFGIEIANPGSEILSQISVSDPLVPDCGRGESGETPGLPLADLAPGESLSYECQSDLLYADLVNVATVSALAGTELVSAEASAAVDVVTPIEIIKAPDEQQLLAGESARFDITLSNPSVVTRTELAVSDPLTPDCDRAIGTLPDLAPGATLSYECRTEPLFAGFTNQATVSAQGPGGSSSASDYAEVLVLAPEIGIVKAPPVQLVDPGASASFTITVSNPGSGDLLSVQVTDAATPDCSRDLGALPPGVSVSYDCATAALDTDFTNLAQVEAESLAGVAVSAAASAFVNVLNTIEIFKLPQEQTLPPGSQASFEITLVNESDGLLTNLSVSDPLSPDCERSVGSLPDLLPNGGSYSYLCLSPVLSADLLNVATVSADSADGPVSATASALVRVLAPQTCFTDQTATSSGEATLCFIGGGPDCGFEEVAYIALRGDPLSPPAGSAPEGLLFPQGLVVQRIGDGCAPGFTAEFSWELPTVMPADTLLWKYGPTSDDPSPHWYSLPTVVNGNVISFSITDGARGDSDLAENGTIVDPGGPASSQRAAPSPIPSLHWLALALLSLMLGLLGVRARRH